MNEIRIGFQSWHKLERAFLTSFSSEKQDRFSIGLSAIAIAMKQMEYKKNKDTREKEERT